ncbi:MAG TPA: protein kinase [Pseudomonadales bacterium]
MKDLLNNMLRFFKHSADSNLNSSLGGTRDDTPNSTDDEQGLADEAGLPDIEKTVLKTKKGEYKLEAFGEGGICQVFKGTPISVGRKRQLDKCILVKRVHPKWHHHKEVLSQFKREINIVSDFIHPQLPHYVDKGELAGQDYFAYEFVEGVSLINLPKYKNKYSPERVREITPLILLQLLDQLKYLHEQMYTIVHGDISVENIVYGNDNKIHLIDFGCAYRKKKVTDESYHWLGKPSYVTPEQAKGESWAEKSDIYQAGILFYELLSGQRWNKGASPREKMLFAANVASPEKDFLSQWVEMPVSELVAKMLEADQRKRIGSARECHTLLKPFVNRFK